MLYSMDTNSLVSLWNLARLCDSPNGTARHLPNLVEPGNLKPKYARSDYCTIK